MTQKVEVGEHISWDCQLINCDIPTTELERQYSMNGRDATTLQSICWENHLTNHLNDTLQSIAALEREREIVLHEYGQATGDLVQAGHTLRWYWETYHSCACGARAESPATHPHVSGCPTARALLKTAEERG